MLTTAFHISQHLEIIISTVVGLPVVVSTLAMDFGILMTTWVLVYQSWFNALITV